MRHPDSGRGDKSLAPTVSEVPTNRAQWTPGWLRGQRLPVGVRVRIRVRVRMKVEVGDRDGDRDRVTVRVRARVWVRVSD